MPRIHQLPRVLSTDQARSIGFSPARIRTELRTERWVPLARGVYLTRPEAPSRSDWARAGLAVAGRGSALSGWDALRLYQLGDDRPPTTTILVVTRAGRANRRVGPVRIRASSRPCEVHAVRVDRTGTSVVPVVGAARAVADTALLVTRRRPVRALVAEAVQKGLCDAGQLIAELEAGPHQGSAWLRMALEDVLSGAASIAEAEAADVLRGSGRLPAFEQNVDLRSPNGCLIAVADMLFRQQRAVLEIDSRAFHFAEEDWLATMRRHNLLIRHGYSVVHYAPSDFRTRPGSVVAELVAWLRARSTELGVAYCSSGTRRRPRSTDPKRGNSTLRVS